MKTQKILIACAAIAFIFTSCEETAESKAQNKVVQYNSYVDSVSKVDSKDIAINWNVVESNYENYKMEANEALSKMNHDEAMKKAIDKTTKKYEDFKFEVKKDVAAKSKADSKLMIYKTLLGRDYDGSDMRYSWINKNNILSVYQNFVDTVEKNKDSYSREQWDEIKLMYEAIDTRKNTVEQEGLTREDNLKIAALKVKFSPMYTFNRMGAKSQENEKAKQ